MTKKTIDLINGSMVYFAKKTVDWFYGSMVVLVKKTVDLINGSTVDFAKKPHFNQRINGTQICMIFLG